MAKKQHYTPRFLLKGFESKRKKDSKGVNIFVWFFEKGSPPEEKSTRDFGHDYLFYGSEGRKSLDVRITKKEIKEYSGVVERVRKDEKIHPSDKNTLVEFVYFQAARTKYTREGHLSAVVTVLKDARQELGTPEGIAQLVRDRFDPNDKDIRREISKRISEESKKLGRPLSYKETQIRLHRSLKNFGGLVERDAPKYALLADVALSESLKKSPELVKQGHNEGLDKWLDDPGLGLSRYLQLQWRVQRLEDNSLILGDPVVLYREADNLQFFAGLGKASLVLLPLSHNLLLIGAANEAVKVPSLDEINRSSAELSLDFFISCCWSLKEDEYHNLIGKRAPTSETE